LERAEAETFLALTSHQWLQISCPNPVENKVGYCVLAVAPSAEWRQPWKIASSRIAPFDILTWYMVPFSPFLISLPLVPWAIVPCGPISSNEQTMVALLLNWGEGIRRKGRPMQKDLEEERWVEPAGVVGMGLAWEGTELVRCGVSGGLPHRHSRAEGCVLVTLSPHFR
jgi:hypothetical protein